MKIINPSIELMRTGLEREFMTPEQFIEKVGRTCYKSEDKITDDSAAKFVSGLIKRGHEAMVEHWNLVFEVSKTYGWYHTIKNDVEQFNCRYIHFTNVEFTDHRERCVISGNIRAWRDFAKLYLKNCGGIPAYMCDIIRSYPTFFPEYHDWIFDSEDDKILIPIEIRNLTHEERLVHQNITVKFTCDRGVSHEIVRHRPASYAQESTRYCNYSQDKFDNEITVVRPSWCKVGDGLYDIWKDGCARSEKTYFTMLSEGATPQHARSVLPNSLKTEVIMTASLGEWEHFFDLRCAPDAHPDMQEDAKLVRMLFDAEGLSDIW